MGADSSRRLADIMRGAIRELRPIPTGVDPVLAPLPGIRAVVFDLYGTLFISEAGDIASGSDTSVAAESAMSITPELEGLLRHHRESRTPAELAAAFREAVAVEHASRSPAEPYPEVVAERLWAGILGILEEDALAFAAAWEASTNKVAAMPGAGELLRALRAAGFQLGIVSNAQAYTPPLFPLLLGDTIEGFGFDPGLVLFSWREGLGKPSPALFDSLVGSLATKGLGPEQAIFVGNDMLKDMYPARRAGLRTCLFAGDRRSLRLRSDDPRCAFTPDAVVVSLDQLPRVVGAPAPSRSSGGSA
jgi:putative hydrolase of the HAD superfamily